MVDSLSEKRLGPSAIARAPSKPRGQLGTFGEWKAKSDAQTSSIALLLPFFSSANNRSSILGKWIAEHKLAKPYSAADVYGYSRLVKKSMCALWWLRVSRFTAMGPMSATHDS